MFLEFEFPLQNAKQIKIIKNRERLLCDYIKNITICEFNFFEVNECLQLFTSKYLREILMTILFISR